MVVHENLRYSESKNLQPLLRALEEFDLLILNDPNHQLLLATNFFAL